MTRHAFSETAAAYGHEASTRHEKLSISLPAELVAELRKAADETQGGVSRIIAASLRRTLRDAEQARIDRALELDAEANEAWADETLAMTARAWVNLEW
jgi:hypothetical protein